jgi:nucleoside-triphosphatase
MNILLSGPPASGKSTLIAKIVDFLKANNVKVGGIVTPEIRKDNIRVGFKVVDLMTLNEVIFAGINLKSNYRVGKYFVDISLFESISIPALENAEKESDIIVIDEIGRMELFSKKFKDAIKKIMNGTKPVLAVVHRNYLDEYKIYGEVYWLERENWKETYNEILSEIQEIFQLGR